MDLTTIIEHVIIAALATVGVIETIKNFYKTKKTWIYSVMMIPLSIACYFACECMPKWVIGGVLTVGITQECYQVLIQSIQKLVKSTVGKAAGTTETTSGDAK